MLLKKAKLAKKKIKPPTISKSQRELTITSRFCDLLKEGQIKNVEVKRNKLLKLKNFEKDDHKNLKRITFYDADSAIEIKRERFK